MCHSALVAVIVLKSVGGLVEEEEDIAINVIQKVGIKVHAAGMKILMILKNVLEFRHIPLNTPAIILAS